LTYDPKILNEVDYDARCGLHIAASYNRVEILKLLLKNSKIFIYYLEAILNPKVKIY
jgi:hypothetical protein